MSIKIRTPDGLLFEVDSAAEAVELARMLHTVPTRDELVAPAQEREEQSPRPVAASDAWTVFCSSISVNGRELLRHVLEHPGITNADLAAAVADGNSSAVSGYLRSIFLAAGRFGIKKTAVYLKTVEGTSRDRIIRYSPGKMLNERGLPM